MEYSTETSQGTVHFHSVGEPIVEIPARYVVIENTPGYMPESEDPFIGSYAECVEYAISEMDGYAEQIVEGGGHLDTLDYAAALRVDGIAYQSDAGRDHDLGRVWTITPLGD